MKFLIALGFLIVTSLSFGQKEYTDTIYYKTGLIRAGIIWKESNSSIRYNYLNNRGKVMTATVRKSMLNKYTIGDKQNSVATDFTSNNQSTVVENGGRQSGGNAPYAVPIIAGGLVIGMGVAVLVVITAILGVF